MRRVTGFDLFRKQEQETMRLDTTTPFKLTVNMPMIAAKWKGLDEHERMLFRSSAAECDPVPLKTHKKRKKKRTLSSIDENAVDDTTSGKKKRRPRNPNMPKRPLSAFIFFSCLRRGSLALEHPEMKPTDCLKYIGNEWKTLTDRAKYHEMAAIDKIRYSDAVAAMSLK